MHIKNLHIQNFKSIKDLKLNANRVNVFIGEPNAGKSNILEALSFFSINSMDNNFRSMIRFKSTRNLFYDSVIDKPLSVKTNIRTFKLEYKKNKAGALMNRFLGVFYEKEQDLETLLKDVEGIPNFEMEHNGNIVNNYGPNFDTHVATYIYKRLDNFQQNFRSMLNPPYGDNIPNLLISNSELKKMVSNFFRDKGYKINLKPEDNDMEIAKEEDEVIYSYPYITISETLQRIVFLMLAIETNKNFTLILDEPESNTFPFYAKFIAERIARDKTNQYFITTHNPYLLMNLIEKTPTKELNVFVTTMKDYQTKVHLLNKKQLKEAILMQHDIFFNLDKFVK
jgi:AAA15 family ATPase/GTPase